MLLQFIVRNLLFAVRTQRHRHVLPLRLSTRNVVISDAHRPCCTLCGCLRLLSSLALFCPLTNSPFFFVLLSLRPVVHNVRAC